MERDLGGFYFRFDRHLQNNCLEDKFFPKAWSIIKPRQMISQSKWVIEITTLALVGAFHENWLLTDLSMRWLFSEIPTFLTPIKHLREIKYIASLYIPQSVKMHFEESVPQTLTKSKKSF